MSACDFQQQNLGMKSVQFGGHRVTSLISADEVLLLASSGSDLQRTLGEVCG